MLGIGGLFDLVSLLGLLIESNDFGVIFVCWGVFEGDYLMLFFFGLIMVCDVWQVLVDGYFFDLLMIYVCNYSYYYGQQYLLQLVYLVNLCLCVFDVEGFLQFVYDLYVFVCDVYCQCCFYKIYDGNLLVSLIEQMQGLDQDNFDFDQLFEEQYQWENKYFDQSNGFGGKG